MENYHIYDEIGKGEFHSNVFKGRQKRKIEYVAIKRVDKAHMSQVVNEVQVMHRMQSPHILKFHDWYETKANLWLILEYCTGADLESLLKQDGHLPEVSVRLLALDMLAGLKYMHSAGLLHCDLRPRNFLVDEYGILKISDFKQARKVPKAALGDAPLAHRGTPSYMAPEVFTRDGVHSYASDFWALGCVLYELRRGVPPFGHHYNLEPALLLERIRTASPVVVPIVFLENTNGGSQGNNQGSNSHHAGSNRRESRSSSSSSNREKDKAVDSFNTSGTFSGAPAMSTPLTDLLEWLLEKDPVCRSTWGELLLHPFWGDAMSEGNRAAPKTLPPQPYFEKYAAEQEKARLVRVDAEAGALVSTSTAAPSSSEQEQQQQVGPPLHLPTSDNTPARNGRDVDHGKGGGYTAGRHTEDIRRFRDREDTLQSIHTAVSDTASSANDYSEVFETDEDTNSLAARMSQSRQQAGAPSSPYVDAAASSRPATAKVLHRKVVSAHTPSSADSANNASGYADTKARAITDALTGGASTAGGPVFAPTELEQLVLADLSAEALLMHASDSQVKPIVGNKAIEAIEKPPYKASGMPFNAIAPEDVAGLSQGELEAYVQQVYKSLYRYSVDTKSQGSSALTMNANALAERSRVLTYLCNVSSSAEVANIVLNSQFLVLLLRIIKTGPSGSFQSPPGGQVGAPKSSTCSSTSTGAAYVGQSITACRVLAATSLALMLRFTTYMQPPTAKGKDDHIVPVLSAILKDASSRVDVKLKRRVVAALGETIFYISAQDDGGADASNGSIGGRSEKGSLQGGQWALPGGVISILIRCLKDETDEIVRHYAAKTIENVLAQGNMEYRRRLCLVDVGTRLLELSQHSRNEALQATCGMALAHMFYLVMTCDPSERRGADAVPSISGARFITKVFEKGGLPGLVDTLRDGQFKQQQAYLNIVNTIFCPELSAPCATASPTASPARGGGGAAGSAAQILLPLQQYFLRTSAMVPTLLRLVENGGSLALRAKALLSVQLLCRHRHAILTEHRLPTILMKLIEPYISQSEVFTATATAAPSSYNIKVALSAIFCIRASCIKTLQDTGVQLEQLCSYQHKAAATAASSRNATATGTVTRPDSKSGTPSSPDKLSTPEKSPRPGSRTPSTMVRQTPPSEMARRKTSHGAGSTAVPTATPTRRPRSAGYAAPRETGPETPLNLSGDASSLGGRMRSLGLLADSLRSFISIASQPTLGRLILGTGPALTSLLAAVIHLLPLAREHLLDSPSAQHMSKIERETAEDALGVTEQAALFALETVAQIDITELLCGAASNGNWPQNVCKYVPDRECGYGFLRALVESLLPAAGELSLHSDGDVRVLVAASLRRLVPAALRAMQLTDLGGSLGGCLQPYLSGVPELLADQPPIPQYTLRLLADAYKVSDQISSLITDELERSSALSPLMGRLRLFLQLTEQQHNQAETDDTRNQSEFYDENSVCFSDLLKLLEAEVATRKKEPKK